jgi:hypothetical protein
MTDHKENPSSLAGFDAIWAVKPEGADGTGGQLKERAAIESWVDAGETIHSRHFAHSLIFDRLYLNREEFDKYRLPLSLYPASWGVPIYLTDRQMVVLSVNVGIFNRIRVRASGYNYKNLHHTGYRIDHSDRTVPWLALFVSEEGHVDYVNIVRFRTSQSRDRFSSQLCELHAATTDPDLARLHRRLGANSEQPPGDIGGTLTPEQVIEESLRMQMQIASGDLRSAWDRRVQLGYGVPSDGVPQADRFWLDAAPALAALHLGGLKDHPMVSMCCGMAEQRYNQYDPEQRAAVEKINALYFG